MKRRKVVQIQLASVREEEGFDTLVNWALCDDGTIWSYGNGGWRALPAIPIGKITAIDA